MNEEKDPFEGGKEVESNWFKFVNLKDRVRGTLIAKHFQKGTVPFPDQYVYELKQEDGNIVNVGISAKKTGTVQRLNTCKIGEIIGIILSEITPSKTAGFAATKNLKVVTWGMDPNYTFDHEEDGEEIKVENVPM